MTNFVFDWKQHRNLQNMKGEIDGQRGYIIVILTSFTFGDGPTLRWPTAILLYHFCKNNRNKTVKTHPTRNTINLNATFININVAVLTVSIQNVYKDNKKETPSKVINFATSNPDWTTALHPAAGAASNSPDALGGRTFIDPEQVP